MDTPLLRSPGRKRLTLPLGFTLIELMVVVVIIGIVLSLILTTAMAGLRRAEERATQGLISKLESGLDDRIDALLQTIPDYNNAHNYMGQVYNGFAMIPGLGKGNQRASVIALYDQMKAELPDGFLVQTDPNYPLNFAAAPYPGTPVSGGSTYAGYFLPLGNGILDGSSVPNASSISSFGAAPLSPATNPQWNPYGTGIFGASYAAAAGFYKSLYTSLGGLPAGYDGVDNNGDGLIDNLSESGLTAAAVQAKLALHTHKTARAEALYAILVEGQGPLGSTFNRDDFTDQQVKDTDGDGLPEFVDAWGEPLQFYRWPIYFHSDLQRGVPVNNSFNVAMGAFTVGNGTVNYPYQGPLDPREQSPLDPAQQLMSPSWWSGSINTGSGTDPSSGLTVSYGSVQTASAPLSAGATAFTTFFHPLGEPLLLNSLASVNSSPQSGLVWDRGGVVVGGSPSFMRRAFFTKFLIASSGPDKQLGIARLDTFFGTGNPAINTSTVSVADLLLENQARQMNFFDSRTSGLGGSADANPYPPAYGGVAGGVTLFDASQDDITNHNYQAPGGLTQ